MKTLSKIAVIACLVYMAVSCRNEDDNAPPRIEKIVFEEKSKDVYVGDTVKVSINATPVEAKSHDKIVYRASESGIVEIISAESGSDGVVFKGLKRGMTIITASANGAVDYLSVVVLGGNESVVPHILVSDYVFECRRGENRTVVASLAGGTPLDDNGFVWSYTGQDKQVIDFVPTNNIGVFDTKNVGESVITVSHPKAQFSVKILVFVMERNEVPVYITTDKNVINLKTTDEVFEYAVNLYNSNSGSDNYSFMHEILDGGDVIGLRANNNIGTVTPKKRGIARIGVSHQKASHRIEIMVIVSEEVVYNFIELESTLVILEEGWQKTIEAVMVGNVPPDHLKNYEFINENNDVISLESAQNMVTIKALKKGKSVVTVKCEPYADFNREILVIVNGAGEIVDHEMYITTNQNVITMEVNGEAELTMTLVGGNSADANSFIWTVDDGSIIEVTMAHGEVRYRAQVDNVKQNFEAVAFIKAKKIGTTKITLENPKSKNDFSVIVKVYKQGVFGVVPVVVDGSSLYQINQGENEEVNLRVVTGLEKSLANCKWVSDNPSVFTVESSVGLSGLLKGRGEGVATLTVSADNMKNSYVATVVVGGSGYFSERSYIYTQNAFMSVVKGSSATFRVECVNMSSEQISALSVVNNDPDKIEMFAFRNNITIKGLEFGSADIVIGGAGLNTLTVRVTVEDYALNPDKPYYLRTDKFIYGAVKNKKIEISVDLVGGIARNEKDIVWDIVYKNVAAFEPAGKKCLITGKIEGQTILKAGHPQSNNDLEIVIYVVLSDNELTSKIVMHISEQNVLMTAGQTRYVSIITNASAAQQNAFQWNYTNSNVINVTPSADKIKAYIMAKEAGNATISIKSGNQIPAVIYVSVINSYSPGTYINVPSIVEMVAGQTVSIKAVTNNINDIYSIKWEDDGSKNVKAVGNGEVCTITAYRGPKAKITVTYRDFVKDIMVSVYDSYEAMASAYVFAAEQNRYVINKDDIIKVGLVFGMRGYPEHMEQNIRWTTQDRTVIDVQGSGKSADIRGLRDGVGKVNVSDSFNNSVDIEIVVREFGKAGKYSFSVREYGKTAGGEDRIVGILAGSYVDLEVKVFNGTNEIANISGIEYELDNNAVLSWEEKPFGIRVKAAAGKEGSGYITLRHNSIEDARILIYTALSKGGLDEAFPILIEKTNYLLKKNESITVLANTLPDNGNRLRNISYDLEKDNGVLSIQERSKTELVIQAETIGSNVVRVRYNAEVVQRIYVSVVEENFGSSSGYMITENIIGIVAGETYSTRVDSNISYGIYWSSENSSICSVVEYNDAAAVLKGERAGKTYVTVRTGDIERKIAVVVVNNEADFNTLEAVNIEQRKYRIRKSDNVTINIHSYQGKVEGDTIYEDYYQYSNPYGNVIAVNSSGNGKLSVKGLNEGTAAIRVKNEYYHEEFVVYVEVYSYGSEGEISVVAKKHYITAEKTLYVIGEREENVYVSVGVVGDDFYADSEWDWSVLDNSIIDVNALGRGAFVNPLSRGTTKIQVINSQCENNPFEITVIVGDRFEMDNSNMPYIKVERDLYEVVRSDGALSIPYSIENVANIVAKNILFDIVGGNIDVRHDFANGVFNITPKETGIGKFIIKYGNLRREVHVLVKENLNAGNIYLTTSENYVMATIGELKTLNIQLVGYNELDSRKLKWEISNSSPQNIIQLSGNGTIGEIYGVNEGEVIIYVSHVRSGEYQAYNTLTINVKIVKDKSKERVVYLTTQRNVIETVKGSQSEIIYIQKVGGNVAVSEITWESSNESVVTLQEIGGNGARVVAHNEGEVRITVRNVEAQYALEIVVIVRQALNNNVYISSAETLLWLTPGEVNRRISVELVNGDPRHNNDFKWSVELQKPFDEYVTNKKVIDIVSSNEACFISTVNEGTALIRVSNPGRAEKDLVITVYVTQFREVEFSVDRKELIVGEYEFVELKLPTYENLKDKAHVWVEDINGDENGNKMSSLVDVYCTNSLVLLNAREEGLGGRDEGFAVVKAAVEGREYGYAQMLVHVVKKADPNVNRVVVGKNIYVMSLKSDTFVLNAHVVGPDIFDTDLDALRWKIVQNDNGDVSKPFITMIPSNAGGKKIDYDEEGKPFSYDASGRMVQISIKNQGTVLLRVMHAKVPREFWKDIYIIIDDMGNYFTIDKEELTVNPSKTYETVSVNIVGGTTQDYAQVRWVANMQQKWDGTLLEIVRILGSGREVTLLPVNDGVTDIYAFYNGTFVKCEVSVVSDYYLDFRASNEYMFPGETRDLPFDIRPGSSTVNWIPSGAIMSPDGSKIIAAHFEVSGSPAGGQGTPQRSLRIMAMNEGSGNIVAMANGKVAQVNLIIAYDYQFEINGGARGSPWKEHPPAYNIKNPDITARYPDMKQSNNGVMEVPYYVYPENTYIEPVEETIPAGLTVEIIKEESFTDGKGRRFGAGMIKFTSAKEMIETVTFQHYKATPAGEPKEPVENGERQFEVRYKFENHQIFPYFMRGEGVYSNTKTNTGSGQLPNSSPTFYTTYKTIKDGNSIDGAQNLGYDNTARPSDNRYTTELFDGEVHHILFDKIFENMDVNDIQLNVVKVSGLGESVTQDPISKTFEYTINTGKISNFASRNNKIPMPIAEEKRLKNFNYEVQLVDVSYNGINQKAVRLFGGKDYIEYTRVGFPQKLYMYVESAYAASGNVNYRTEKKLIEKTQVTARVNTVLKQGNALWYQATKGDYNAKRERNTGRIYYMLPLNIWNGLLIEEKELVLGRLPYLAVADNPDLTSYRNQYIYYFTSIDYRYDHGAPPEVDAIAYKIYEESVVRIATPEIEYYYTYDAYNTNRYHLDYSNGANFDNLIYDENYQACGGYFISYESLGVKANLSNAVSRTFYEYDLDSIREYIGSQQKIYKVNGSTDQVVELYEENGSLKYDDGEMSFINNWDYGFYNEQVDIYLNRVNDGKKLISSYVYKFDDLVVVPGAVTTTKYDVFKNELVGGEGVFIKAPAVSETYRNGKGVNRDFVTFRLNCRSATAEYFLYENMWGEPAGGGNKYEKIFINVNGATNNTGNLLGANIFARNSDDANKVEYGKYSNFYFVGVTYAWHQTKSVGLLANAQDLLYNNSPCKYTWRFGGGISHDSTMKLKQRQANARQMLKWDGASGAVVPYYIFNRFPYRYEDIGMRKPTQQVVKLDDGPEDKKGRPMPSVNRENVFLTNDTIRITITSYDFEGNLNPAIEIDVNIRIKPCHSMYNSSGIVDSTINDSNIAGEVEGEYNSFDNITSSVELYKKFL